MSKIKAKIVKYFANEAYFQMQEALGEVQQLQTKPQFSNSREGPGLDLAVLREKMENSIKLMNYLR